MSMLTIDITERCGKQSSTIRAYGRKTIDINIDKAWLGFMLLYLLQRDDM